MDFYFISQNTEVRVKKKNSKGGFFFEKKNEMYRGDNTDQKEVITKRCAYVYGGKWCIGTKYVWGYGMLPNQEREKYPDGSYSPKAALPIFITAPGIYDMENKSIVEKLRTFEDLWQLAHQKLQQTIIKIAPPGVKFDVRGLDGIILNGDKNATPLEVLKMYQQTGSFPFSSIDADGNIINSSVIEPIQNNIGSILQEYIGVQQHYMRMMDDIIDVSNPNANSLVGVEKISVTTTQNALKPIYTASSTLILRSKKRIALMVQDSIEHNYEGFTSALGSECTDVLKMGKDLPLSTFGLELEVLPDDEEKLQIEFDIKLGLQPGGGLFLDDAYRIRQELKSDTKKAIQLMVMLIKKNKDDAQAAKNADIENNGKVQMQSTQIASQMKQQELQLEAQTKIQALQAEYDLKSKLSAQEHQQKMEEIAGSNVGMENVANINAGKSVSVQSISTEGKLQEAHVRHETAIQKEKIIHESGIQHGFQAHDHTIEQMEKEAELTPAPTTKK